MTAIRCNGCSEWGTAANSCGVFYYLCDCGTITSIPDFRDKYRADKLIWRKKERMERQSMRAFIVKGVAE